MVNAQTRFLFGLFVHPKKFGQKNEKATNFTPFSTTFILIDYKHHIPRLRCEINLTQNI